METEHAHGDGEGGVTAPHFVLGTEPDEVRAWEEIDAGRYMPRRIRGSCKGRALG
jgi:hypothetical protein